MATDISSKCVNVPELDVITADEPEFDVITAAVDDDDDERFRLVIRSEKLISTSFDGLMYDDVEDIMPIQKLTSEDYIRLIVGTGSTVMVAGSYYIPKLDMKKPLGEDANFICVREETIGVADGVGGWAKKGIDSGEYSRELMINAVSAIKKQHKNGTSSSGGIDVMGVLDEAFLNTKSQGSSTACILTLVNDTLHAVNVGDSGFVVIREGSIVYKSEIQQSRFNCPYQLGNDKTSDDPSVAQKIRFPVKAGDVIVMGTDGLFDNVHDFELETIVNNGVNSWETDAPDILAWRIAEYALDIAKNTKTYTPFSRECAKVGFKHKGGKYDDITVIVANIWPL